jgi:hypothetical protein
MHRLAARIRRLCDACVCSAACGQFGVVCKGDQSPPLAAYTPRSSNLSFPAALLATTAASSRLACPGDVVVGINGVSCKGMTAQQVPLIPNSCLHSLQQIPRPPIVYGFHVSPGDRGVQESRGRRLRPRPGARPPCNAVAHGQRVSYVSIA